MCPASSPVKFNNKDRVWFCCFCFSWLPSRRVGIVDLVLCHLQWRNKRKDEVLVKSQDSCYIFSNILYIFFILSIWTWTKAMSLWLIENNFVLHREKIAEAENNGANCVSARKTIPLTESNTCNNVNCATMNHGKNGANSFEKTTLITQREPGKYYFADFFL